MKPEDLLKHLDRALSTPVYLFTGDNEFVKEEVLQRLLEVAIEPGTEAFSLDVLSGEQTDARTVLTLAATMPMLTTRRVVVVREFQRLAQSEKDAIVQYAEQPNPTTLLILITSKVDLKTKVYARLVAAATHVEFAPLYPERLPEWVQQRATRLKKRMSMDACHALVGVIGSELHDLAGEVEKLAMYVGARPVIEVADVEAMMGPSRAGTVFDLSQAVGEKDLVKAYRALHRARDAGEAPHALVAILVRHLTILWKIRFLQRAKQSDEDIKRALKQGFGFNRHYPRYVEQSRLLTARDLRGGFETLLHADITLKTTTQPPWGVMERLVYALCTGKS